MSEKPEIELDLDLQLLPAWARQPQTANRYANFEGSGEGDRRGPRSRPPGGPRRDFRGDRRPDARGPRPPGPNDRPARTDDARGPRFRPAGPDRGDRRFDGPRSEPIEELPEGIDIELIPDPAGVDSLAKQIRHTGRAYPLFDIAHLILKRPDRYHLEYRASGNHPDGSPRQFHICNLDDTLWLTESDAVRHVLSKHFGTFYKVEKIAIDPPKGTYTFVAQCGMSGAILGPPNLHGYQAKLQRLHAERFSRLPFDVYKSRVRIVRDEAVVKQWIEEQSFKFEYVGLNLPEPLRLESRDAVEQHFREVHLPNIVKPSLTHLVRTPAAREALPGPLRRLSRRELDLQQRFPLRLVTRLSEDFAHRSLHFFKVNKTVLHVAVARPRFLDREASPVSDGVKRIVETIQATPDCTRRKLLEGMGVPLPAVEVPAATTEPAVEVPPSAELSAIIRDLHWLIHEGHVIEFATGRLEVAKRPAPRPMPPPRPPRPPSAQAQATTAAAAAASSVPAPASGQRKPGTGESLPESQSPSGLEAPVPPAASPASAGVDPAAMASDSNELPPIESPSTASAPEEPAPAAAPALNEQADLEKKPVDDESDRLNPS